MESMEVAASSQDAGNSASCPQHLATAIPRGPAQMIPATVVLVNPVIGGSVRRQRVDTPDFVLGVQQKKGFVISEVPEWVIH
jgi:hypothetical protein